MTAPSTPVTETEIRARLDEVERAMNSPAVSTYETPATGARARRNHDRMTAWLALDRERDWLLGALCFLPEPHCRPYEFAPRAGLVAEAFANPGRSRHRVVRAVPTTPRRAS